MPSTICGRCFIGEWPFAPSPSSVSFPKKRNLPESPHGRTSLVPWFKNRGQLWPGTAGPACSHSSGFWPWGCWWPCPDSQRWELFTYTDSSPSTYTGYRSPLLHRGFQCGLRSHYVQLIPMSSVIAVSLTITISNSHVDARLAPYSAPLLHPCKSSLVEAVIGPPWSAGAVTKHRSLVA